ncbi:MAG TPA: class I adenylate-forming enzyme family protein [Frankiaceae bacterium]|nr:class I adenylate-forming enzyme family protein [Frankiaceae bacterium]
MNDGRSPTLPERLREQASARGHHPLLICDDEVLTYAGAEARSAALAKGLLAYGAGKGTRVALLYPNGADLVVGVLAAARIGAIAVPLSTFSTAPELRGLLRGADIDILLATPSYRRRDYADSLREAVPDLDLTGAPLRNVNVPALRHVIFAPDEILAAGQTISDAFLGAVQACIGAADRLVIVHTSGSTSAPKGVIHQHGALLRHLDNLNDIRRYGQCDVLFSNSPFFWIGGFAYGMLGTLLAGATLVCSNAVDPGAVLDLLEATKPTMVNGFAGTVAHLPKDPSFAQRDLSSIRRGNLWPIMPADVRAADPELRHNMLGMTEAGSVCLVSDDEGDQPEARRGSFGRPAPGFEAKIVDPETGAARATGEVGELCFRGPFLMEGYYGRERHETFDAGGWYHTGDLFHVDDDGFYYFTGRSGDMIKTAGANVSPREVEAAILDLAGLVAHVVGIEDAERGELVAAAIRVPAGQREPDGEQLRRDLRAKLSAYKVPQRVVFLADQDVPMLSSGKLDSRALKERLRGH